MSSTPMVLAVMETEHFTFRSLGADEDCAKRAILRGWEKHIQNHLKYAELRWDGKHHLSPVWEGKTVNEIEDWYSISIYYVELNECLRDDECLHVR